LAKNIVIFILIGIIIVFVALFMFNNEQGKNILPAKYLISEREWDFGLVKPGEKHTHIFKISNEGDEELIIDRVRASCACIKASISATRIKAGKSAELTATFDTTGYEGKIKKDIYIKSNDYQDENRIITLFIEIEHLAKPSIDISKTKWDIGLVAQGDTPRLSFIIENKGDSDLIIDKIDSFEYIKHNIDTPLSILPGGKYEVILTYNSTEHKIGEFREIIQFFSNDPEKEKIFFNIKGYCKEKNNPAVTIFPVETELTLAVDSEEGAIKRFTVESLGDKAIEIISIKTSADYLTPLRTEFELDSKKKEDFQIVLLKDKANKEIEGDESEEYIYLTIALPVKINK
jgi:hypothetical protein